MTGDAGAEVAEDLPELGGLRAAPAASGLGGAPEAAVGGAASHAPRLTAVVSRLIQVASSTSAPSVPYSMSNPPGVRT